MHDRAVTLIFLFWTVVLVLALVASTVWENVQ